MRFTWLKLLAVLTLLCSAPPALAAADYADIIDRTKPAIVGIGTFQKTRRPPVRLLGTGFGVLDGRHVLTNLHVIPDELDAVHHEYLTVMVGSGRRPELRRARLHASDPKHDLAVLRIEGAPVPVLELAPQARVREGGIYLFTGFPIGAVLGLYPATHRAMIAAITPIVIPADRSSQLDPATVRRLRAPYDVYQLDGTAYPGNSGSPLYQPESGRVVGIINKVFVKETRESALSDPSGISYAIPVTHAAALLQRIRQAQN
ncbi:trypsin-like serine proteases [Thiohalobacter thiocyanaticus]|uniref:Trypsin-like serine proteases n=1 Tax=Thiohalobacter thiocyanaticus TaxID=585455 RepID=A0A1Z4VTY7_9GAMM|nr:serine protease [Thiohalobacter thiocyanaticus]BAZ94674.1 trypsin-like serine proteases [Thiohalobacter thiocyanaticus]